MHVLTKGDCFLFGNERCKTPKAGPSGATGIAWQPIGVEPIFDKARQESEMTPPDSEQS